MTQASKHSYIPLEWEDVQFINHVCDYVIDKKFRPDNLESNGRNIIQKQYTYNHYKSELRSLLTMPEDASIDQVGEVLWFMKNIDRMYLLKKRPSLIKNCPDLGNILRNYTKLDDALLFACSEIRLLYHPNQETRANNIDMIAHALPLKVRTIFSGFANHAMAKEAAKYPNDHHKITPDPASFFSAGTFMTAIGILAHLLKSDRSTTASALIGAAGCFTFGLFGLYQKGKMNHWHSIWAEPPRKIEEAGHVSLNQPLRYQ